MLTPEVRSVTDFVLRYTSCRELSYGRITMPRKHRFICLLLIALLLAALAACGKGTDTAKPSEAAQISGQASAKEQPAENTASQAGATDNKDSKTSGSQSAEPAKLTGKLELIALEDRDPSVLRGLRIIGNGIGSQDDINGKASSLTDVRCIFALNEWIEFYPDTDAEYALRVWILEHRDDPEYYNTCKFSDLMPGFVTYCDLHYPDDAEDPGSWYWGNFYLNPEDCGSGYYDFVFTYEGKAIATLLTRFYNEGELSDRSGAELEALMHE